MLSAPLPKLALDWNIFKTNLPSRGGNWCRMSKRGANYAWKMDGSSPRERERKTEIRIEASVSRSVALKMISISFLLFFFFFLIRHERYDPLTRSPLLYLSTVENERSILVRFIFFPPSARKSNQGLFKHFLQIAQRTIFNSTTFCRARNCFYLHASLHRVHFSTMPRVSLY